MIALTAAAVLWAAAAAADEVKVRVERRTYPVAAAKARPGAEWQSASKLRGQDYYETDTVILENRYLEVTVLPEFGGRITRVLYKPTRRDLFWVKDALQDGVSWSMGGGRWSFPFWEHGRHFDETGGYAVVRRGDGSVTVAIDMRFDEFLKPEETGRYGRATCLRLAQFVTLAPDEAAFAWSGRVTNPLPIRYGFKLWYLLRQPGIDGTRVILPAVAVTSHGAPALQPWDPATVIHSLSTSVFAVGMRQDFAGWYFPGRDLNVLRVQDHNRAPGSKQVLYPPGGYVEMWGGSNEVFEECGRMLPAFGAYEMRVKVLAAEGIGPADFAGEHAAASCRKVGGTWHVRIAPTGPRDGCVLTIAAGAEERHVSGLALSPEKPYAGEFDLPGDAVRLVLRDASSGIILLDQTFPVDRGPMPSPALDAAFRDLQARVQGTMPGGKGLYAEATDLVSEHQLSLPRAAGLFEQTLETSDDVRDLLDAARRLMRVRKDDPKVLAGLEKVLAKSPDNAWANLYKAMWLQEAGRAQDVERCAACLQKAASLPGGRYLLALLHIRQGGLEEAKELLRSLLEMKPQATFFGPDDPALLLMQPGATVADTQPRLLLAILLQMGSRKDEAEALLRPMVEEDPALTEAWMLLGDGEKVRTLTAASPHVRRAAEANLAALRAARWAGIGRP